MENERTSDVGVENVAPPSAEQTQSQPSAAPLPTFDQINADAPVVTPNVLEERMKRAASSRPATDAANGERPARPAKSAPLGAFRDESKRRREGDEGGDNGGEKRDRRRDRRDRPVPAAPRKATSSVPVPNRRAKLGADLEDEFNALLSGESLETLMKNDNPNVAAEAIEDGTKVKCRVESIQRDSVFVDVGGRELGLIPLKQFPEDASPQIGQEFEATVVRYNATEGVYEVALPFAAAEAGDWLSLSKGSIVEAQVLAANTGGLECKVGNLRAFLPKGQIDLFFVEDVEKFVGERWKCVVTEINPERRNLVISRRTLLEQERAEKSEKLWEELAVGQNRDGFLRKIINVGAFVDLGGVDGFIPISEMGWGRVNHPSEVVQEGTRVDVVVVKLDREKNRVTLSLKNEANDPWKQIDANFREGEIVRGRVSNIQIFGAFVELAPGIEGLVHISEIHYKRVSNVADVLQVGDFVDVQILGIDLEKRKISLSMKRTQPDPREVAKTEAEAAKAAEAAVADAKAEADAQAIREKIRRNQPKGPLKGGLGGRNDDNGTGLHF